MKISLILLCLVGLSVVSCNGMLVGGYTKWRKPTASEMRVFESVKSAVKTAWFRQCEHSYFRNFIPILVKSQVVAGTNYIFRIQLSKYDRITILVFKPLPHTGLGPQFKKILRC